jgi:hypothetical protein
MTLSGRNRRQLLAVLRTLFRQPDDQIGDRFSPRLAQALAEFGRIDKTLHSLTYIDDEDRRRATLTQLRTRIYVDAALIIPNSVRKAISCGMKMWHGYGHSFMNTSICCAATPWWYRNPWSVENSARCALQRTMSLNCIQCSVTTQTPSSCGGPEAAPLNAVSLFPKFLSKSKKLLNCNSVVQA